MGLINRLQNYGFFPDRTPHNGNGNGPVVVKTQPNPPVSFIPRDSAGNTVEHPFYGRPELASLATRETAYAVAAYCYVAMRYRAEKMSEAPLMVVEENDDGEEWLKDHELAGFLDVPSPDFDMAELLFLTRLYRDMTGMAIWVKDRNGMRDTARLTPFSGIEFEVKPKDGRIYGEFSVETASGPKTFRPDDVIFFREINPNDWWRGLGWVEVALSTLNLSEETRTTVRNLLRNAVLPSMVIQTHPEWNPNDEEFEKFEARLDSHSERARKGKAMAVTGGGTVTRTMFSLKDMVPDEVMDRVEATVSACSGVPAVVLQFLVGLKNSPWSQMEEARRMGYEDTIETLWKRDEKILTRQLLREFDPAPNHYIRFDRSRITALKADDTKRSAVVAALADVWTVDMALVYTGQEPRNDDIGAQIISHAKPQPQAAPVPRGGSEDGVVADSEKARRSSRLETKAQRNPTVAYLHFDAATRAQEEVWRTAIANRLQLDRTTILALSDETWGVKAIGDTIRRELVKRLLAEIDAFAAFSRGDWHAVVEPLIRSTGRTALRSLAADVGIAFDLLIPGLQDYTLRHAGHLVTQVTSTTRDAIASTLETGLRLGEGMDKLRKRIEESDAAFGESRAELIARTETVGVTNGAQLTGMRKYAAENPEAVIRKTWLATDDERTRETHSALSETEIGIDETFENGCRFPGDPDADASEVCNCRCTLLYSVDFPTADTPEAAA